MSQEKQTGVRFDEMKLRPCVSAALQDVGYDKPTPIQALTIPHLAAKKDVLGQARTGTGKTAAFALPLLSRIDLDNKRPQVLVLTPTRELAIQVAQSFKDYGAKMKGLNVLPVYGGQNYGVQLGQLKKGAHVVVGTPGRLMDHMRRKTVSFADLFSVVLDEADEMLHMGFINDVEWIMEKTPDDAQIALFSATMPVPIRKIAKKYLKHPEEIIAGSDAKELGTITQQYWMVKGAPKSRALVRILEGAAHDGVIVFVKTKTATLEVAKNLEDNGFNAEAINGDMVQTARERTINRLKNSRIDILVATDVAARGLDVDRISHVINYDMPAKVEPYIHRIGRTGRAGRQGCAILFVRGNEKWMLKKIEKKTRQSVEEIFLPSNKAINKKRKARFKNDISRVLASQDVAVFKDLVELYALEENVPLADVAAALAKLAHGDKPFLLPKNKKDGRPAAKQEKTRGSGQKKPIQSRNRVDDTPASGIPVKSEKTAAAKTVGMAPVEIGMERYRIEVGRRHGVKAGDIVGAISNEAGLEGKYIKNIKISPDFSLVDLPFGMPKNIYSHLRKTWVRSRPMAISRCAS